MPSKNSCLVHCVPACTRRAASLRTGNCSHTSGSFVLHVPIPALIVGLPQVLELLQSSNIPAHAVDASIPSELQPLSAAQASNAPAAGPTSPLPTSRATTPQAGGAKGSSQSSGKPAAKGGRAPSAAGGKAAHGAATASNAAAAAAAAALAASGGVRQPAAAEGLVVPLEKHITSIISASKQEVEVAAKAYYAAKVSMGGGCRR